MEKTTTAMTTARKFEFANTNLKKSTQKLFKLLDNTEKNKIEMCYELAKIETDKTYADDFKNLSEYSTNVLGMSKATAYSMVSIGKEWVNETGKETKLYHNGVDWNVTQLYRLLKIGFIEANELALEGVINPLMSIKELEKVLKSLEEETETEETETETEETETETEETEIIWSDVLKELEEVKGKIIAYVPDDKISEAVELGKMIDLFIANF